MNKGEYKMSGWDVGDQEAETVFYGRPLTDAERNEVDMMDRIIDVVGFPREFVRSPRKKVTCKVIEPKQLPEAQK